MVSERVVELMARSSQAPAAASLPQLAGSAPQMRWPFRLLSLLFVLAAGLAVYGLVRGWLRGDWTLGPAALGELGTVASCAVMTVVFAWAGVTGRVPDPLWRLFQRFVRWS